MQIKIKVIFESCFFFLRAVLLLLSLLGKAKASSVNRNEGLGSILGANVRGMLMLSIEMHEKKESEQEAEKL